jgi:hypothetical protein
VAIKLEQSATVVENAALREAVQTFSAETESALNDLAYDFAHDLRELFAERGLTLAGRPPILTVGDLVLHINIAARKGQWFYGKEPLTRLLPLSTSTIIKGYEQWHKQLMQREIDAESFLAELYKAWQDTLAKRTKRPSGGRINIIELLSQLTMNRQSARFWNSPSRKTFKEYERHFFVRDLVLLRTAGTTFAPGGQTQRLRLGVASKSQADQATRSIWLPDGPLDGQYYSDLLFDNG